MEDILHKFACYIGRIALRNIKEFDFISIITILLKSKPHSIHDYLSSNISISNNP